MSCSYVECGDYQVTPVLMAPCDSMPCCDGPALCYPCLPRCPKGQIVYCCERKPSRPPKDESCCQSNKPKSNDRQRDRERDCSPDHCCPPCKHPTCNPVKTKYVIPCYRYEDGRIVNQPTVLTRRACEVAVGCRPRRKPFCAHSYCADEEQEVHRYVSEDERGNCCYHFEKKKNASGLNYSQSCHSCPQCPHYADCVPAKAMPPNNCYYYCC